MDACHPLVITDCYFHLRFLLCCSFIQCSTACRSSPPSIFLFISNSCSYIGLCRIYLSYYGYGLFLCFGLTFFGFNSMGMYTFGFHFNLSFISIIPSSSLVFYFQFPLLSPLFSISSCGNKVVLYVWYVIACICLILRFLHLLFDCYV